MRAGRLGFTLVELIVAMLIVAMLAAMAIPRLSRGSDGAKRTALRAHLATMRQAIGLYAAEHLGQFPGPTEARFVAQLTLYTNAGGQTNGTKSAPYVFGPYLSTIPAIPLGPNEGSNTVLIDLNSPPAPQPASGDGWVYNPATGEFRPNLGAEAFEGDLADLAGEGGGAAAAVEGP